MPEPTNTKRPEREFQIIRGGKVAVWRNNEGRSISISHPRFKDQSGNWRDGSFRLNELPQLIHELMKAMEYFYSTPLESLDNDPVS